MFSVHLKNSQSLILLILSLLYSFASFSQSEIKDPKLWTPEDIVNTEAMRSPVFSPDATMVVWSKREPVKKKDKFLSNLYLTRLNIKDKAGNYLTTRLTQGEENDYSPVFSKDGKSPD